MSADDVDQRVFYRLAIRLPVSCRFAVGSAKPIVCTGSTVNLSAGGMLLETRQPDAEVVDQLLADRSRIELQMHLGGRLINVLSGLVWVAPTGPDGEQCQMGLRFLDLDSGEQERIWEFVLANKAS